MTGPTVSTGTRESHAGYGVRNFENERASILTALELE